MERINDTGLQEPSTHTKRILIVGDIPERGKLLAQIHDDAHQIRAVCCPNGAAALDECAEHEFHCVVASETLHDMPGISVLGQVLPTSVDNAIGKVLVRTNEKPLRNKGALMTAYGIHEIVEVVERDLGIANRIWSAIAAAQLGAQRLDARVAERLRSIEEQTWHEGLLDETNTLVHALRTPLSVVLESVSLVLEGVCGHLNGEQEKFLAQARGGCAAIEQELDRLMAFARSYPNGLVNSGKTANLAATVDAFVARLSAQCSEYDTQIAVGMNGEIPKILGDENVIASALWNLLGTAGTTPNHSITLLLEPNKDRTRVLLKLTESGAGSCDPYSARDHELDVAVHVARYLLNSQDARLHVEELSDGRRAFCIEFRTA